MIAENGCSAGVGAEIKINLAWATGHCHVSGRFVLGGSVSLVALLDIN